MEGSEQGFSAMSSLIRLISMIDLKLKVDDICGEMVSDLSKEFGIGRLICLGYE